MLHSEIENTDQIKGRFVLA